MQIAGERASTPRQPLLTGASLTTTSGARQGFFKHGPFDSMNGNVRVDGKVFLELRERLTEVGQNFSPKGLTSVSLERLVVRLMALQHYQVEGALGFLRAINAKAEKENTHVCFRMNGGTQELPEVIFTANMNGIVSIMTITAEKLTLSAPVGENIVGPLSGNFFFGLWYTEPSPGKPAEVVQARTEPPKPATTPLEPAKEQDVTGDEMSLFKRSVREGSVEQSAVNYTDNEPTNETVVKLLETIRQHLKREPKEAVLFLKWAAGVARDAGSPLVFSIRSPGKKLAPMTTGELPRRVFLSVRKDGLIHNVCFRAWKLHVYRPMKPDSIEAEESVENLLGMRKFEAYKKAVQNTP